MTEAWEKSGDNWFYLDSNGEMATDQLIEDGDNYYHVDESGVMAVNKWVAVDNEDVGNDNEPQQWWYYFQANGKAMQNSDNNVRLKTINGKKYAFDSDARMVYGWIQADDVSIINDDDDAWQKGDYYFGDENDGTMTVGWKLLDITDEDADTDVQNWINPAFTDDENQSRWFYFKANGKKTVGTVKDDGTVELKETTINGKKYGFDEYGRMVAEWSYDSGSSATSSSATPSQAQSQSWKYFNSVADGARVNEGWFKVVPPENLNSSDFDESEEGWYYADNKGHVYAQKLKSISGKKYAFNETGEMLDGMKFIRGKRSEPEDVISDDDEKYPFDTEEDFDANAGILAGMGYKCYYFGDEDDGAMRTGKVRVEIDGTTFDFRFGESGSRNGVGITGKSDNKLYNSGKLVASAKDEKYQIVMRIIASEISEDPDASETPDSLALSDSSESPDAYDGFITCDDVEHFLEVLEQSDNPRYRVYRPDEWDPQDEEVASLMEHTGLKFDNLKDATGMTSSAEDKYDNICIFTTVNMSTEEEKLGFSSDMTKDRGVCVVNTSGKISSNNAKNKDGNDVNIKLYNDKLTAAYTED